MGFNHIFNSLGSNYSSSDLGLMVSGFNPDSYRRLEKQLSEHYNKEATLTYKGREAIYLGLKSLDLKPGSKIGVNGYTCFAVYDAITRAGCEAVYIDVEKNELNFSAEQLEKVIKKEKLDVVLVQNTLGVPADIEGIEKIVRKHKIVMFEDLAHCVGMIYGDGREAGEVGDLVALSFSQDKVVDAVSGGALLAQEKISNTGKKVSYFRFLKDYYYILNTISIRTGYGLFYGKLYNFILRKLRFLPKPMDGVPSNVRKPETWHAAVALKQFSELHDSLQHRMRIAQIYADNIDKSVQMEHSKRGIYIRFPLQIEEPRSLIDYLESKKIHVSDTWYEVTVSPRRKLEDTNYKTGMCKNAEEVARKMVNLPTHVNISVEDARRIAEEVEKWRLAYKK